MNLTLDKKICIFIWKELLVMIYLESVDSYYDYQTGLVYTSISKTCRDTCDGTILNQMREEWWDRLTPQDISRIHINGGLY